MDEQFIKSSRTSFRPIIRNFGDISESHDFYKSRPFKYHDHYDRLIKSVRQRQARNSTNIVHAGSSHECLQGHGLEYRSGSDMW